MSVTTAEDFRRQALKTMFGRQLQRARNQRDREALERRARENGIDPEVPSDETVRRAEAACKDFMLNLDARLFRGRVLSAVPFSDLRPFSEGVAALCLAKGLKASQIRNFFGHVRGLATKFRIAGFDRDQVEYLRVILAYAYGRHGEPIEFFRLASDGMLNCVGGTEDFERFLRTLEAVVAYHKYHGGGD